MAININAKTTGVGGLETSADNSGEINIQSGGSTVMNVTSSGVAVTGSFSQNGAVYSTQPTFRNLIINGDMRIAQRGTSVTGRTTGGYLTIDRFDADIASGGTWSQSQSTEVPSSQGFTKSYKFDCTATKATLDAGSKVAVQTKLEGQMVQHLQYGSSNAQTVTLSFWVKSNKTGTYTLEYYLADDNRHYTKTYTIDAANTWEKKTITIAGDTTGVIDNDNGNGLLLKWWLSAGSNFTGGTYTDATWAARTTANAVSSSNVNLADSTSNDWYLTGVQLEVGSTATEFEHLPVDVELARCQRYYYRNSADSNYMSYASGRANSTTVGVFTYNHPVTMRALPTYTQSGTGINTPSQLTVTSLGGIYAGKNSSFVTVNVASGLTAGNGLLWNSNNNTTSYVEANAEL